MAEIINLRRQRKRKQRKTAEQAAAANRAKFGRTAEQKKLDEARADADQKKLDGLRRETRFEPTAEK